MMFVWIDMINASVIDANFNFCFMKILDWNCLFWLFSISIFRDRWNFFINFETFCFNIVSSFNYVIWFVIFFFVFKIFFITYFSWLSIIINSWNVIFDISRSKESILTCFRWIIDIIEWICIVNERVISWIKELIFFLIE